MSLLPGVGGWGATQSERKGLSSMITMAIEHPKGVMMRNYQRKVTRQSKMSKGITQSLLLACCRLARRAHSSPPEIGSEGDRFDQR